MITTVTAKGNGVGVGNAYHTSQINPCKGWGGGGVVRGKELEGGGEGGRRNVGKGTERWTGMWGWSKRKGRKEREEEKEGGMAVILVKQREVWMEG